MGRSGDGNNGKSNGVSSQEHIPVFVLNGYEDLELFRDIEPADLDYLRIHQPEHRAKILTAIQLLHDLQCELLKLCSRNVYTRTRPSHSFSPIVAKRLTFKA